MHTGPADRETTADTGVVIPVRSFVFGKARLASALDSDARLALMQRMAAAVVGAAGARPTVVVTSAPEVVEWCTARGVATIADPGSLDEAAEAGRAWAAQFGLARVVVAHADLPFAGSLDRVATSGPTRVAVLVPARHDDGTPVLSVPVDADFEFAYGPGSFARHVEAARRAHLQVVVVRDTTLGFDVDVAEDLTEMNTSDTAALNEVKLPGAEGGPTIRRASREHDRSDKE